MVDRPAVVDVYMHLDCGSYKACIDTLRQQLANHPQHENNIEEYGDWIAEHPLLPEQEAFRPKRLMHVNFIMEGTRKTTLAIRGDNVYVMGFSNMDGKWYELGIKGQNANFITGSTLLGCGVRYATLLAGDSENGPPKSLDEVALGKRCAEQAVDHLSTYNKGPGFKALRETKLHLVCLILMISEATRMFPHYKKVRCGWKRDIILKNPRDPKDLLLKYLRNWESISNAMIGREGYSKTLKDLGIKDRESAFGVVYLMLNSTTRKTKKNQLSSPAAQGNGPKGGKGGQRENGGQGGKGGRRENGGQGGKGGSGAKGGEERKPAENGKKPPRSKQGSTQPHDEEEPPPISSAEESQPQQQEAEEPPLLIPTAPLTLYRELEEKEDNDVNSEGNDDEEDDELADLGQLLVEVFSVRASSGVVDTIAVFDGKRGHIIYNHDGEGDAGIATQTQRNLQLTGPYEAISADGRVAIQVSSLLAAGDASDQSSNVYWATLWDGYEEHAVYDEVITKSITMGTRGNTKVTYAVLSNAVEATVQVQLKFGTVTIDSIRFHGQITAKIEHFEGESILFSRHSDEAAELFSSSDSLIIPLARSVVVVPLYSTLVLNVKLHVVCPPNHEVIYYKEKKLVFDARTISSEDIERSGVTIQVSMTSEDIQPLQAQSNGVPPAAPSASTPLQTTTSVPQDPANNSVLNTTTAKDVTPSLSASEDMLRKATIGEVVDEKVCESSSAMHISESGIATQEDQAVASLDTQTLRDKTTKTKEPTTPSPVVSYIPKDTPKNKNRLMAERKGDLMVAVSLAKCVLEGAVIKAKSAIVEKKLRQRSQHVLEFILHEFQNIKPLLNVVDGELVNDVLVNSWVMQIQEMTYYVDDHMDRIVEMDTESRRLIRRLRRFLKFCGSVVMRLPLNHKVSEIEQLKDRIEEVCRRNVPNSLSTVSSSMTVGEHQQQTAHASSCTVVVSPPELKILVEGSDGTRTQQGDLTQLLTRRDADLQVISLWGTTGDSGRISVIRKSYSDPQVCHDFKCRAWVKLTHPFNPQEFIRCLMAQFYASEYDKKCSLTVTGVNVLMKMETTHRHDLYNEFDARFSNMRYLVVLEDLSAMPEWDAIMTFLPDRKNGSTIIVSSQQFEVASLCAGRQPHQVFQLVQLPTKNVVHAFLKDSRTGGRDKGGLHFSSFKEILLPEKAAAKEWIGRHSLVGHGSVSVTDELGKYLHDADSNSSIVTSVWGIPGVGKSALVRSLYCHEMLNDSLFEKYSWVDVSHPFNLRDFCRSLLKYFHPERDPIQECQQLLVKYRCLIVIDDLQTTEEWDMIQAALLSRPCNSVIIIIATEASIATYCADCTKAVFSVKGIEADAASDLLKNELSSLHQHNSVADHDSAVVRELVLKCGGLPKVIIAIAALLTTKTIRGTNPVGSINDKFMEHLETNPGFDGLDKLFSWIHSKIYTAPDNLKACIFYLPIFPRNYIIRRRRLIRRWIAECYSIDIDERSAEEEGENLFSMLLDLGVLQQLPQSVNTVFNDSRMILCQINGFIHEYIISRQMEDNSVFELGASSTLTTQRTGRHLVILESWDRDRTVFESIDFSRLRSLTVFGKWESFFISKSMRWIHVLDLEGASGLKDEDLIKLVKWLHFLKFLSLRGCSELRHLPSSLGHLVHLQTLDVRNTSIVTLPESIAKLQELEYIRAGNTVPASEPPVSSRSRFPVFFTRSRLVDVLVPSAIGKLTTLHTLGVVNVAASGSKATVEELQKLTQLRKLGVSGINEKNGKRFISAISDHLHLESLSVRLEENNESCLDGVVLPWENLRSLKLFGLQDKLPESPAGSHVSRIKKVELEMAILLEGNMRFLGLLPELCVLRIKQLKGSTLKFGAMRTTAEEKSFEKVKVLQIACGCSSSGLDVAFGSETMKNLELLKIDCCGGSAKYQFSGLENLKELKLVLLLGGSNAQALKDQLESQLCDHPNLVKPVVKLEELQRSS